MTCQGIGPLGTRPTSIASRHRLHGTWGRCVWHPAHHNEAQWQTCILLLAATISHPWGPDAGSRGWRSQWAAHITRLYRLCQGGKVALTMLAHIDVQVLLGAELVRELLRAERLPIFALLYFISWTDLHLLIFDHIWSIRQIFRIIVRLLHSAFFCERIELIWSFMKALELSGILCICSLIIKFEFFRLK